MSTVAVVSGGMDSVTLAHHLVNEGHELAAVASFDYGQRHARELGYAALCATRLNARHYVVDLSGLGAVLPSALTTDGAEIPHGHYADESMRATVVPNRNLIMLAVAGGIAAAIGADTVATGVHAGDHPIYPDCRPEFIAAASEAIRLGTSGLGPKDVELVAPFVSWSKTDIARLGAELDVPWDLTWSCYEGGEVHCGKCGTCVERREALDDAGVDDPTVYA